MRGVVARFACLSLGRASLTLMSKIDHTRSFFTTSALAGSPPLSDGNYKKSAPWRGAFFVMGEFTNFNTIRQGDTIVTKAFLKLLIIIQQCGITQAQIRYQLLEPGVLFYQAPILPCVADGLSPTAQYFCLSQLDDNPFRCIVDFPDLLCLLF